MSKIKPFTGVDDRIKLADAVPLDTPFTLNIFPSEICNFKCSYCAQSLGRKEIFEQYGLGTELMTLQTAKLIAEQSKKFSHKYKLVSMMGHGEPLCNKNLPQIIDIIKSADVTDRIDVITNASLLTKSMADGLIDSGLDVMRVSLQGISSESYKNICGVNMDFDEFYSQLAYFYERSAGRCKVFVKTMDIALKDSEIEKFYKLFDKISDRMFIDKVKPVYDKVSYTAAQQDISIDRYGNIHTSRIVCPQPFYMMSVWTNGDVSPCDALYKANTLGNIYASQLIDMWHSQSNREFCLEQLKGKRFSHPRCSRCCAPDDVVHKEDILDDNCKELLLKYQEAKWIK